MNLSNRLNNGLNQLGYDLDDTISSRLISHIQHLAKWNKTHNLTAIRDLDDMLSVHVLDSLSIGKFLTGKRFLDLGTGAGFPGIPLAIAYPDYEFVLMDSISKKVQFIQFIKNELNLTNVTVVQSRVENYGVETLFDGLVTRAVSSCDWIYKFGHPLLTKEGKFYLMLGKEVNVPNELMAHSEVIPVDIPYLNATRNILIIKNHG